jgi:hypothetical protein
MAKRKFQRISDLPKATRKRLERAVLAQARQTIERAKPQTIKQAVCNMLHGSPIIVAAICAEVERVGGAS